LRDPGDPLLLTAVMSSATNHVGEMLSVIFSSATASPPSELAARVISLATAMHDQKALARALNGLAAAANTQPAEQKFASFAAFLDALDRRKTPLEKFTAEADAEMRGSLDRLESLFATARTTAAKAAAPNPNAPRRCDCSDDKRANAAPTWNNSAPCWPAESATDPARGACGPGASDG
jgi:hypothetical protein